MELDVHSLGLPPSFARKQPWDCKRASHLPSLSFLIWKPKELYQARTRDLTGWCRLAPGVASPALKRF